MNLGRLLAGTGLTRDRRRLSLASAAVEPKVRFLAPPRSHAPGYKQTVVVGGFAASRLRPRMRSNKRMNLANELNHRPLH